MGLAGTHEFARSFAAINGSFHGRCGANFLSTNKLCSASKMWTATAVFLTALAAVVSAQDSPECSDLGFGGQARRFPGELFMQAFSSSA